MEQNFDEWNELKKKINYRKPIYVSERDISQIKLFDTRRMARKIGVISVEEFQIIKNKLRDYI